MRRRVGRPGLVGTMARTAVIAGTATAVSGSVSKKMSGGGQQQAAPQQAPAPDPQQAAAQQQAMVDQAAAQAAAQIQAQEAAEEQQAAAAASAADDARMTKLAKLGELKAAGVLTDEEFAAEKAKVLNS